ncbi:ABC transporter ATP-binding protein [Gracilibacillus sp. YIM 98692]|uniref:ABC transporter ATP-binding protein n=1 Tax=Gracilibacillus sp. YIM 98692 TaxID=2663532 RepID=UPI0013D16E02|nr:ABC transporter ATP-binding protein [Gracilibacillus sp. YIM 98692]
MFTVNGLIYKNILHIDKLEIPDHKIICLFGESGSGKSTLLKMFNQMLSPDDGEITYKSQPIQEFPSVELRREVVMLGQDPIVFDETVRENLQKGLEFAERELEDDQTLIKMLGKLKLDKSLDEDASKLSGGEKQRIALARVLLMKAEVYLMDEPTSALDENTEHLVMDVFTEFIRTHQKTAVMVTHSKEVAEKYADQVVYMSDILNRRGAVT